MAAEPVESHTVAVAAVETVESHTTVAVAVETRSKSPEIEEAFWTSSVFVSFEACTHTVVLISAAGAPACPAT